jgi:hypothetical protein
MKELEVIYLIVLVSGFWLSLRAYMLTNEKNRKEKESLKNYK